MGCAFGHVAAVVSACDGEGAAEFSWAAGEGVACGAGDAAVARHCLLTGNWIESANEDAACVADGFAGDIEAVVDSIDEVDVGVAGGSEDDFVARRTAGGGVRGGIVYAEVGFRFDDAAGQGLICDFADKNFSEEVARYDVGRWIKEGAREWRKIPEPCRVRFRQRMCNLAIRVFIPTLPEGSEMRRGSTLEEILR